MFPFKPSPRAAARRHRSQAQHSPKSRVRRPRFQRSSRIFVLYGCIALLMLILVGGLAYRQLIQKADFDAAAERQNHRRILLPGPRGVIYDRNGNAVVTNRPVFTAAVYLNELRADFRRKYYEMVRDQREIGLKPDRFELNTAARRAVVQQHLDHLNAILDRDESVDSRAIERHFRQSLLLPFPLIEDLDPDEYAILLNAIPIDAPIQILTTSARSYPFGPAAAHTLGFVSNSTEFSDADLQGDELLTFRRQGKIGRAGIERAFNDHLSGAPGSEIWTVDPGGFRHERVLFEPPSRGRDLHLSIDIDLQLAAESALAGKTGAAIAIDVQSGEVLAIASLPAYDLNDLSPVLSFAVDRQIREQGAWLHRAVQGLYPPGSTFKLITAAAALRHNAVDADTIVDCQGAFFVGRRRFLCHRHSGHGPESLVEALRDSCNVFFYDRGLAIGVSAIAAEARRFHLDRPTGIELPAESQSMLIPDPDWKARRFFGEAWFDGDTANMSIGQGFLLVTPLQMATFAASLARKATFIQPTLIHNPNRRPLAIEPIDLPSDDLALILEGMRLAGERGTARLAASPTIPVAGKTGTAQVRVEGRPSTLAWFIGFAPAQNPRVAVAVMVEGVPDSTEYGGGATAAPIARTLFQSALQH